MAISFICGISKKVLLKSSISLKKINFIVFLVGNYLITTEFDGLRSAWREQDY